jgi:hypothetical protein
MMFLASNKFDFNKLFYESVTYMSLEKYKTHTAKTNAIQAKAAPFQYDDPECIIFCNSKFEEIRDWLPASRKARDSMTEAPELKIDLSFCSAKLFMSLIENLKHMFPQDIFKTEIINDELGNNFYLSLKLQTKQDAETR